MMWVYRGGGLQCSRTHVHAEASLLLLVKVIIPEGINGILEIHNKDSYKIRSKHPPENKRKMKERVKS
jgi:hypothetical protein